MMVMSQFCRLFVPFWGGECPLGAWRGTPTTLKGGSTVQWDTSLARWAGEGNDWIKLMAQQKPRKEDVVRSLLESLKQAVEKTTEPNGTRPTKKPRGLPPLELGIPEARQWPTLEIRGDCKTIVDWVNSHAKRPKTFHGNGEVEEFAYDSEPPSGSHTPFVNTTKKPTCGQTRARRSVWKKGWTLPELRGQKLLVSVDFGTAPVATAMAIAGAPL